MRFSRDIQHKFRTVLRITIAWTIISVLQVSYEASLFQEYGFAYRWSDPGEFGTYFLINTLAFVLNGFIGGLVVVFLLQSWIRDRSYTYGLLFGMAVYTGLFFLLTGVQNYFVVSSIWDGTESFYTAYWQGMEDYFFSFEFVRIFPFWLLVLAATLITLFVSDKYGPGIFTKFLRGKYFHPKSEERIFMFLDLRGSTTIAEQLGEEQYFAFIRRVFRDVTPVVLETEAEIYQYVGDEIVLTWPVKLGLKDANCIRCFQHIEALLLKLGPAYAERFGVRPVFKAGLHVGRAIVGEVGVIKRDIAYSGDVLNTTARIQSKCNELGATLLLSEDLVQRFPAGQLSPHPMGEVPLKGKAAPLFLYSL